MKLTIALIFASSAMASIITRDATVVNAVLNTIGTDIDAASSAVEAYRGDETNLVKTTDKLVSDLKDGKIKVANGPDLTPEDTINLSDPMRALAAKGTKLAGSLNAIRPKIEKAGQCKIIQDGLSDIKNGSEALIKAVISKVPAYAQDAARALASGIIKVLDQAVEDFKDCP